MKTTPPRTLVSYMNTHIGRWKKQLDAVQKVIDSLPPTEDNTANMQADDYKSKTLSDISILYDEENKGEANPLGDQEPVNMNNPSMIT